MKCCIFMLFNHAKELLIMKGEYVSYAGFKFHDQYQDLSTIKIKFDMPCRGHIPLRCLLPEILPRCSSSGIVDVNFHSTSSKTALGPIQDILHRLCFFSPSAPSLKAQRREHSRCISAFRSTSSGHPNKAAQLCRRAAPFEES